MHSVSVPNSEKFWILKCILSPKDFNKGSRTHNLTGLVKGWAKWAHGGCSVLSLAYSRARGYSAWLALLSLFPGLSFVQVPKSPEPALLPTSPAPRSLLIILRLVIHVADTYLNPRLWPRFLYSRTWDLAVEDLLQSPRILLTYTTCLPSPLPPGRFVPISFPLLVYFLFQPPPTLSPVTCFVRCGIGAVLPSFFSVLYPLHHKRRLF